MGGERRPLDRDRPPRTILVVCTRRIGDVLLVTPLVRSLKCAWPQASVDVMVFRGTEGVLGGNPDIARVLSVGERDGVGARLRTFRDTWRRYDLACSAQTSDRTTLYAWAAGRRRVGLLDPDKAPAWKRTLLHDWAPFDNLRVHTVVAGLALCDLLGIPRRHDVVVGRSDADAREAAALIPRGGLHAVLHVTPKFPYKGWTAEGWARVAAWLSSEGLRPIVCAGGDTAERQYVADLCRAAPGAVDAAGRLSLGGVGALIATSRLYIGTDTAVTHLAAATGVPTLALFGPSNPVKWGPWPAGCVTEPSPWQMVGTQRSGNVTLLQGEAECVPCLLEGCDRHVNSLSRCLQELRPERVIREAKALLAGAAPAAG